MCKFKDMDMKRNFLQATLWSVLLMSSCAREENLASLRIRLGVQVSDVTRGAVNDAAGLSAVGDKVGIYGMVTTGTLPEELLTTAWGEVPLMDNVRTTSIDASTGALDWSGSYNYPVEEGRYVKFCAYHPYAAAGLSGDNYVVAPGENRAPQLYFTLTGAEDVMLADPVLGGKQLSPDQLVFEHKLTQIRFQVSDESGSFTGQTLNGITFNGVNTTCSMDLETGEMGAWGTPSDGISAGIDSPVAITGTTAAPEQVGTEVMLQPGQSAFNVKIVTSKGTFGSVAIRPTSSADGGSTTETAFAAGRSYLITLIFRGLNQVAVTASVTPWVMDGTGEGIVE